jgi:hypothetical protein
MHLEPYLFADDAGKWNDKDVVCLCGYLFDGQKLDEFTFRWNRLLRAEGFEKLHMTQFRHQAKKRNWDEARSLSFLLDLAAVARECTLIGFSVGYDAKYYRSLPKDKRQNGVSEPHVACLQRMLRMVRDRLHAEKYQNRITFVIDEEEGSVVALYQDMLKLRNSPNRDLGKYVGAVCFADDTFYVPLQAGDMLANLTYKWFGDVVSGVTPKDQLPEPLKSLLVDPATQRGLDFHSEFWTAEALDAGIAQLFPV